MTDARLPERWLNDRRLLRLSDRAFRLFTTALMWSVSNRTDGVLYADDLALMPAVDTNFAAELVKASLWSAERDFWVIADFESTQTSSNELRVLENARKREREKKRRQRARGDSPGGTSPGTVPGDSTGQDRQGQDRQDRRSTEEDDWPEVSVPATNDGPLQEQPTTDLEHTRWADDLYDRER